MALSKEALEVAIQTVLDTPPVSHGEFATAICDAIDSYLEDIEMDSYPGPTANPSGTADPSFAAGAALNPVVPSTPLKAVKFRAAFLSAVNNAFTGERDFSACEAEFVLDIATLTATKEESGYEGTGSTVCPSGPDVDAAFDAGLTEIAPIEPPEEPPPPGEFAKELAKQIHDATTSSNHVGVEYSNVAEFIGAGHTSSLK